VLNARVRGSDGLTYRLELLQSSVCHDLLAQTIVPRPIAWVLSDNGPSWSADSRWNLAPFSFFTVAAVDPPTLVISIGPDEGREGLKDTMKNLERNPHAVIHIAHEDLAPIVRDSGKAWPPGESEVTRNGLELVDWDASPVPRLAVARVAYAGRVVQKVWFSERECIVLFAVTAVWVDSNILGQRQQHQEILIERLQPLSRLGSGQFGRSIAIPRLEVP
jgi:flavin reductase (DIM6/NTAB) family NADH-FMN oxidoreductase RutF